ncbi:hypothetical protein CWC46_14110 [Prodigiosinella confusarubida]|uniref:Uncharacterized protein n=1 Tax=Serratia sp. (strain ATCC 39006) TaxID=104623 RepID=A0A2I5T8J7_SERS3|nr:hypothetical protein [Serratia sp. ATCC 39006]AUH00842.1 hypothetical protein CWC46_14110 [Serratia sp. ATCC 39006]AUH05164.1 hypothetical protein Ser39006_014115 [Serratia sp. ATCC 39006]
MPIYRKNSGGVFAPVTALNINDSGKFKSVAAAWINDNGTFKKIFPATPSEPVQWDPSEGNSLYITPSTSTWVTMTQTGDGFAFYPTGTDYQLTSSQVVAIDDDDMEYSMATNGTEAYKTPYPNPVSFKAKVTPIRLGLNFSGFYLNGFFVGRAVRFRFDWRYRGIDYFYITNRIVRAS